MLVLSEEIRDALAAGRPVVALETTLIAHGFPPGDGLEVGRESENAVREAGAVPATVGVLDRALRVGLAPEELQRFDASARKAGPGELAACVVSGAVGATTVGGTLAACRAAGVSVLATGGIGGVHRGFPAPPDVSADLAELARTATLVVCSGIKSLLDVEGTLEALETLGIPVAGWRTDTLPRFYTAEGGPPLATRVDDPADAAQLARTHWSLDGRGLLLAQAPPTSLDVDALIEEAVSRAHAEGIRGGAVTPRVLAELHERSSGRTLAVNHQLIVANARLAAEVAVELAGR